ncbi:hypothetical protein K431DRAFT_305685 [Polychaeton citri CBS 116435]|uniref:Uncharacterized protein n=1 Tax=Polychaeton citri CBS 116435 TaxID=1314669 RepID=A0A9P4Q3D6_9PEZI|nr:hypothetical protein K431DRAFT_305685 [Polychaeton citri CBS 116435]
MPWPFTYGPTDKAYPEQKQNKRFRGEPWVPGDESGPRRNAPRETPFIEWDSQQRGWYQGERRLLRSFKPNCYFTRPVDGKRRGAKGRLLDAVTGEGPDVFITISSDKRTKMRDRPQRWQWTGRELDADDVEDKMQFDPDFRLQDLENVRNASWCRRDRAPGATWYNFRTRQYEAADQARWVGRPDRYWMDAQWRQKAKRSDQSPLNVQLGDGVWWSRVPISSGLWPGGRPKF